MSPTDRRAGEEWSGAAVLIAFLKSCGRFERFHLLQPVPLATVGASH